MEYRKQNRTSKMKTDSEVQGTNRVVAKREWIGEWAKEVKGIKRYRPPVIRQIRGLPW